MAAAVRSVARGQATFAAEVGAAVRSVARGQATFAAEVGAAVRSVARGQATFAAEVGCRRDRGGHLVRRASPARPRTPWPSASRN